MSSYFIPLPKRPLGRSPGYLNIVDGQSSAVQRALRRDGLAEYEPPTMAAMMALFELEEPGFTFFDVGANVGLYTLLCAKFFPDSTIVAFEPAPDTARIARKLLRVNGVQARLEECALGAELGEAQLFLSAVSDASNSLVEGFKENVGTVTVQVDTLDRFAREAGLAPRVMKIDAESFEPQVIEGGRKLLAEHQPTLIVEVLNRRGHDHGVEMMQAMQGLGYHYYPCSVYSDWKPVTDISGDPGRDRDWLLSPRLLPDDFVERVERWEVVLERCGADRNRTSLPEQPDPQPDVPAAEEPRRLTTHRPSLAARVRDSAKKIIRR